MLNGYAQMLNSFETNDKLKLFFLKRIILINPNFITNDINYIKKKFGF